jgi:hypothetical protein
MITPAPPFLQVGAAQDGTEKLQLVDGGAALDHIRPSNAALNIVMVFGAARKVGKVHLSPCACTSTL